MVSGILKRWIVIGWRDKNMLGRIPPCYPISRLPSPVSHLPSPVYRLPFPVSHLSSLVSRLPSLVLSPATHHYSLSSLFPPLPLKHQLRVQKGGGGSLTDKSKESGRVLATWKFFYSWIPKTRDKLLGTCLVTHDAEQCWCVKKGGKTLRWCMMCLKHNMMHDALTKRLGVPSSGLETDKNFDKTNLKITLLHLQPDSKPGKRSRSQSGPKINLLRNTDKKKLIRVRCFSVGSIKSISKCRNGS